METHVALSASEAPRMAANRVLLIDDDAEFGSLLSAYLGRDGFQPTLTRDGETGVAEALGGGHDIVVVDIMAQRINGIEVLRRLRAKTHIPVLMLTACGDEIDRILGLELGADDHVSKPCTPRELAARLRAILRRLSPPAGKSASDSMTVLCAGRLELWPQHRAARFHGQVLPLTGAEFNLLELLMRQAGRLVSKSALAEQGLRRPLARFDRSIDVHISNIRQKLSACPGALADPIHTVRGMGYLLTKEEGLSL